MCFLRFFRSADRFHGRDMDPLPPEVFQIVRAARGWLELGDGDEAEAELLRLPADRRQHPIALELHWQIAAKRRDWSMAHALANELVQRHPRLVSGWIHRAYSARRMEGGGLEKALAELLPAATSFPGESMVAYNLACYLTRLGRVEEGWRWYQEAEKRGEAKAVRALARQDDDLRELWDRLER
jgi:predicted Zn-dependent protease